jgi:glyoxylase-like metal-dependent hydrolase (beta-lactamase superfamily II)
MKMHIMANGILECDSANLIAMPKLANSEDKHTTSDWVISPVYTVLLEHPDGLVLFDTACHPDAMNGRWNQANMLRTPYTFKDSELLPNTLRQLGYSPSDIDYVVLSHLHEDHGGCLELFTSSKIYVSDAELTQTLRLYALDGNMGGYIRNDIKAWLEARLNWVPVDAETTTLELLQGISILNFGPGHTFGMMGLFVELENSGNFILASDTINTSVNLGPPIRYPGLAYDTIGYYKTVERIARLANHMHAQILFGHDVDQFSILKKSTEGFYD